MHTTWLPMLVYVCCPLGAQMAPVVGEEVKQSEVQDRLHIRAHCRRIAPPTIRIRLRARRHKTATARLRSRRRLRTQAPYWQVQASSGAGRLVPVILNR